MSAKFSKRRRHRKDWETQDKRVGSCKYKQKLTCACVVTNRKKALLCIISYTLTCTLMLCSLPRAVVIAMHICRT